MDFIYVVESEKKFQKEIWSALQLIAPAVQARFFDTRADFIMSLKILKLKGPEGLSLNGYIPDFVNVHPIKSDPNSKLLTIVGTSELCPFPKQSHFIKLKDLLIKYKVTTDVDTTSFVITLFEDTAHKAEKFIIPILNNIIYKPFDDLILQQDLSFAIYGRHKPSVYALTNQKTSAIVEMLKEVELESISELGFISVADRAFPSNSFSKYYSQTLISTQKKSAMARLIRQEPHPYRKEMLKSYFAFIGLERSQITQLRKKTLLEIKKSFIPSWNKSEPEMERNFIIIESNSNDQKIISEILSKGFKNATFLSYHFLADFLYDLDPKLIDNSLGERAISETNEITLIFDKSGRKILETESPTKKTITLFGYEPNYYLNKDLWLGSRIRKNGLKLTQFSQQTIGENWNNQYVPFLEKERMYLLHFREVKKNANGTLKAIVREASNEEKLNWLSSNNPLPKNIDGIFVEGRYFSIHSTERWKKIKELCEMKTNKPTSYYGCHIFILGSQLFTSLEEKEMFYYANDIYYKPLDRAYIFQKTSFYFPSLTKKIAEPTPSSINSNEVFKVGSNVSISEISEAGLILDYYRPLPIGQFREFVLWQPYEAGAPEVLGNCNFTEENKNTKSFKCHFVFFGLTDSIMKRIRIWIRDNYIQQKKAS